MSKIDANLKRFLAEREEYLPPRPTTFDTRSRDSSGSEISKFWEALALFPPLPKYPIPEQREKRLDLFYQVVPYNYYTAWKAFGEFHDAYGMQTVATLLDKDKSSDVYRVLHDLRDSIRAAMHFDDRKGDRSDREAFTNPNQELLGMDPYLPDLIDVDAKKFAQSLGFVDTGLFIQAALQLQELAKEYDTVIAITEGGLSDGYAAHLLGLDPMIWDLHAHGRKKTVSRWITPFDPKRIEGKRVLLLDKDSVTGATIVAAKKELDPYHPSRLGVYFHHDLVRSYNIGTLKVAVERIQALGVTVHYPSNTPLPPLKPFLTFLHEKFGTPPGRLKKVTRALLAVIEQKFPKGAKRNSELARLKTVLDFYHGLNPLVPGMDEVLTHILRALEFDWRQVEQLAGFNFSTSRAFSPVVTLDTQRQLVDEAESLARARYKTVGDEMATARGISNTRVPHSYTAAFAAAKEALDDGYDIALIVGPEAFAWEPIFEDLGLPVVAINIPEDDYGGERSLQILDDLERVRGKKVLVVEDDVQSGATLRKIKLALESYAPARLGLYLGNPSIVQQLENIPPGFNPCYVAEKRDPVEFLRHLTDRADLFQTNHPPAWFEEQLFSAEERKQRVPTVLERGIRRYLYQSTVPSQEWTGLTQAMVAKLNKARADEVEVAVLGYGETSGLIGALLAFGVRVTAIEVLSQVVDLDDSPAVRAHRILTPKQLNKKFPHHEGRLKVVDIHEVDEDELPDFDLIFGITPESATIDSALMLASPNTRIVFQTFPYGAYELDKMQIERSVTSGEFRLAGKWDLSRPLFETRYGKEDKGATLFLLERGEGRLDRSQLSVSRGPVGSGSNDAPANFADSSLAPQFEPEEIQSVSASDPLFEIVGAADPLVLSPAVFRIVGSQASSHELPAMPASQKLRAEINIAEQPGSSTRFTVFGPVGITGRAVSPLFLFSKI